jgi:dihydroorotase
LIDVGGNHVGRYDVALRAGRVSAVGPDLSAESSRAVVDVAGLLVTPGLIDLHTHVHSGATYWGIDPDPLAWCSGVTTWVDAGSSGAFTFPAFRQAAQARHSGFRCCSTFPPSG